MGYPYSGYADTRKQPSVSELLRDRVSYSPCKPVEYDIRQIVRNEQLLQTNHSSAKTKKES